jgi:undecaprenyl-diphosphatase
MLASLLAADRALGVWLASWLTGPWLDRVMMTASLIATFGTIWIVIGIAAWVTLPAKRMAAWRLLLSIGLCLLTTECIIKPLTGRTRPYVNHPEYRELLPPPDSSSFPSGHAAMAAAAAVMLTRLWPAAAIPAWTFALLVAGSRIALGVHFPSDVLAGLVIGYLVARLVGAGPPHERLPAVL